MSVANIPKEGNVDDLPVRVVKSTLVKSASLELVCSILHLDVSSVESARSVGALGGHGITSSGATSLVEPISPEFGGEVGVAISLGSVDSAGAKVVGVVIGDRLNALVELVGVGSGNDNLEVVAPLTLVGGGWETDRHAPEGCLDHGGGRRVGAVRARVKSRVSLEEDVEGLAARDGLAVCGGLVDIVRLVGLVAHVAACAD